MIEKKFVSAKKQEFMIKEYVFEFFGKGRVSNVRIERTPVGEKIIIYTSRPGLIVGKKGENLQRLVQIFKKNFGLEAPQIEIADVENVWDAKSVADQIALSLERFGSLGFKIVAYKMMERLAHAGVLGAEIILSGKLPSERAKSWRFAYGYMQKTGELTGKVDLAKTTAQTLPGSIGVKVSLVPANAKIPDQIKLDKTMLENIGLDEIKVEEKPVEKIKKERKKKSKEKSGEKK
jgi:small subunit ribosomal protein S3